MFPRIYQTNALVPTTKLIITKKHQLYKEKQKPNLNAGKLAIKDAKTQKSRSKLECGPMPNLMVALPNTGGALCSTPQSLADAHY